MSLRNSQKEDSESHGQDLFKAFVDRSKKSQQDRDKKKIEELEAIVSQMQKEHDRLEKEYIFVKEHLQKQNGQLRLINIKLDSQNKAMKAKSAMLQDIIKQTLNNNSTPNMSELTAYRLIVEENNQLKALIKKIIVDPNRLSKQ